MEIIFQLHGIWRWVLLFAAAAATVNALIGWLGRQPFARRDNLIGLSLTIAVDVQFLLGLLLWIGGPINLGMLSSGMSNSGVRFLLIEHPLLILVALILTHIGRSRTRKAASAAGQHRIAFIFYGLSLLCVALVFLMPQ